MLRAAFTLRSTSRLRGSAVGEVTGTIYRFIAVNGSNFYLDGPYPSTVTGAFTIELISRGSASNVHIAIVEHITVNAQGTVTAEFFTNGNIHCG
jgi:hypothetical protein